jgi:hypothetical protein
MKNFENYFKKEKWTETLLLFGVVLLISFPSYAGSIRDVSRNIEKVKSIEPPFQFALIGDSRDGGKVIDSLKKGRAMDRYPVERDALHQLFLKANVKAVFEADDHRYDRMEKDHILYLITGGGGAPLTSFKERGRFFHYVWISVQQERIEGEVVDLEGRIRDRFMIE